ncbi:uncharacterized protein LOC135119909 isoform X2 [Zophobas morio]|uniref:uncharacterized protein LOC135119909 isoform X2 n=1 Tax=Zophobas morio TaxID=2755281 RepID=UPI0030836F52
MDQERAAHEVVKHVGNSVNIMNKNEVFNYLRSVGITNEGSREKLYTQLLEIKTNKKQPLSFPYWTATDLANWCSQKETILQLSNFILEKNICGKDLYDLKDNEVSKYLKEAGVDDESLRTRFCEHVQLLKLEAVPLQNWQPEYVARWCKYNVYGIDALDVSIIRNALDGWLVAFLDEKELQQILESAGIVDSALRDEICKKLEELRSTRSYRSKAPLPYWSSEDLSQWCKANAAEKFAPIATLLVEKNVQGYQVCFLEKQELNAFFKRLEILEPSLREGLVALFRKLQMSEMPLRAWSNHLFLDWLTAQPRLSLLAELQSFENIKGSDLYCMSESDMHLYFEEKGVLNKEMRDHLVWKILNLKFMHIRDDSETNNLFFPYWTSEHLALWCKAQGGSIQQFAALIVKENINGPQLFDKNEAELHVFFKQKGVNESSVRTQLVELLVATLLRHSPHDAVFLPYWSSEMLMDWLKSQLPMIPNVARLAGEGISGRHIFCMKEDVLERLIEEVPFLPPLSRKSIFNKFKLLKLKYTPLQLWTSENLGDYVAALHNKFRDFRACFVSNNLSGKSIWQLNAYQLSETLQSIGITSAHDRSVICAHLQGKLMFNLPEREFPMAFWRPSFLAGWCQRHGLDELSSFMTSNRIGGHKLYLLDEQKTNLFFEKMGLTDRHLRARLSLELQRSKSFYSVDYFMGPSEELPLPYWTSKLLSQWCGSQPEEALRALFFFFTEKNITGKDLYLLSITEMHNFFKNKGIAREATRRLLCEKLLKLKARHCDEDVTSYPYWTCHEVVAWSMNHPELATTNCPIALKEHHIDGTKLFSMNKEEWMLLSEKMDLTSNERQSLCRNIELLKIACLPLESWSSTTMSEWLSQKNLQSTALTEAIAKFHITGAKVAALEPSELYKFFNNFGVNDTEKCIQLVDEVKKVKLADSCSFRQLKKLRCSAEKQRVSAITTHFAEFLDEASIKRITSLLKIKKSLETELELLKTRRLTQKDANQLSVAAQERKRLNKEENQRKLDLLRRENVELQKLIRSLQRNGSFEKKEEQEEFNEEEFQMLKKRYEVIANERKRRQELIEKLRVRNQELRLQLESTKLQKLSERKLAIFEKENAQLLEKLRNLELLEAMPAYTNSSFFSSAKGKMEKLEKKLCSQRLKLKLLTEQQT